MTVTAVTSEGKRASKKYPLIIKKPQETAHIVPSISSGVAEATKPITFTALTGGPVRRAEWRFGDSSLAQEGAEVIHTYQYSGVYTIELSVEYVSGVLQKDTLTYSVK